MSETVVLLLGFDAATSKEQAMAAVSKEVISYCYRNNCTLQGLVDTTIHLTDEMDAMNQFAIRTAFQVESDGDDQ